MGAAGRTWSVGRPITGTPNTYIFVPANANDNDVTTYFEGSTYPSQVTVALRATRRRPRRGAAEPGRGLGSPYPDHPGAGREPQIRRSFVSLAGPASTVQPDLGRQHRSPSRSAASYQNIQLQHHLELGAPGGQVAEFQVFGAPAPNPDLTITGMSVSPASPVLAQPSPLIGYFGSGSGSRARNNIGPLTGWPKRFGSSISIFQR